MVITGRVARLLCEGETEVPFGTVRYTWPSDVATDLPTEEQRERIRRKQGDGKSIGNIGENSEIPSGDYLHCHPYGAGCRSKAQPPAVTIPLLRPVHHWELGYSMPKRLVGRERARR